MINNDVRYNHLWQKLSVLPIEEGSSVTYIPSSQAHFFNLILPGAIKMTITQYENEFDQGAYVNVMLDGEAVIQDYMSIEDIVTSMLTYYNDSGIQKAVCAFTTLL